MSGNQKTELRLVHSEAGISAAALDPGATLRRQQMIGIPLVGLTLWMLLAAASGIPALMLLSVVMFMLGIVGFAVSGIYRVFHHLLIGPHALRVRTLRARTIQAGAHLDVEVIRSGEDALGLLGAPDEGRRFLYSEITATGYTDYSLWFEASGERHELQLDSLSRNDIRRLEETLRTTWERARGGMTTSPAEADAARRALGHMREGP